MQYFPVFLDLSGRRVLVAGAGDVAEAKLRLLLKTNAAIEVYGHQPSPQILKWAADGKIALFERHLAGPDIADAALLYCAHGEDTADMAAAELGESKAVLVNVVDNLKACQFLTPAIVDRDPVTVAIGTEGAAPVLARMIKSDLEARLPASTGALARIARMFRHRAALISLPARRRSFWRNFFSVEGPLAWSEGGEPAVRKRLGHLLTEAAAGATRKGSVHFLEIGSEDPDLLTAGARRLLENAGSVIHDPETPPAVLELARREAEFTACAVDRILESMLTGPPLRGETVVCLFASCSAARTRIDAFRRHLASQGLKSSLLRAVVPAPSWGRLQEAG